MLKLSSKGIEICKLLIRKTIQTTRLVDQINCVRQFPNLQQKNVNVFRKQNSLQVISKIIKLDKKFKSFFQTL